MAKHMVIKIPIKKHIKDIEDWATYEIYEYIAEEIMRVRWSEDKLLNLTFKKGKIK